ncbi:MAG: hypothetical protein M0Z41_05105 [Peptococcaceae bacterium]|nr:hypothetical protein [Peptococcaceae bacterium]
MSRKLDALLAKSDCVTRMARAAEISYCPNCEQLSVFHAAYRDMDGSTRSVTVCSVCGARETAEPSLPVTGGPPGSRYIAGR